MKRVRMDSFDKELKEKNKLTWIMRGRWSKLTTGEKVARVALKVARFVAIAGLIAAVLTVVVGVGLGLLIAAGMTEAIVGGFGAASRAYRPGEKYVRFR